MQTQEYLAGDIPQVDFNESKLPLYHALFKISYNINPQYGWIYVHLITILIIFLTSFFIFLIGKNIKNKEAGFIGALLYAIFSSSFNRHFLATNGEIIFNFPVTASFYFILQFLKKESSPGLKGFNLFLGLLGAWAATQVKFHGNIILIFLGILFLFYRSYYRQKFNWKQFSFLSSLFIGFLIFFWLDLSFFNKFAHKFITNIQGKIFYALAAKGTNPFIFLVKFFHRQGLLFLWHLLAWLPALIYLKQFLKNKGRDKNFGLAALALLFSLTYLMVLGGGLRLYFHYFLATYPSLTALAGIALVSLENKPIIHLRKNFKIYLLIPALFFLAWNSKDVIIKNYYPQAFYQEGPVAYWTRAVLVGTFDDYLLPHKSYLEAVNYIKKNTKSNDRIFVWGDGPYLYYFSGRRMGGKTLWYKNTILKIIKSYASLNPQDHQKAKGMEKTLIQTLKDKNPLLFIDTSPNGLSTFNHYYNLEKAPQIYEYVKNNYLLKATKNKMKIYRLKK